MISVIIIVTYMKTITKKIKTLYYSKYPELIIWVSALVYLALIDPFASKHLDLCVFHNIGIEFCPGCGLGRSIAMLFEGEFVEAFKTHPLGLVAVAILSYRIFSLLTGKRISILKHKEVYNG